MVGTILWSMDGERERELLFHGLNILFFLTISFQLLHSETSEGGWDRSLDTHQHNYHDLTCLNLFCLCKGKEEEMQV